MKKIAILLLFSTALLCLPAGLKRVTQGFRLAKLRLEAPFLLQWETPPLNEVEKEQFFNQPFDYLDRGAQCYVFASRDGKYVLKLFRYDQPLNPLRRFFREKFRNAKPKAPFQEKIEQFFSACILAYQMGKEETGLLYLHLNPTENQLPTVKIRAPLGQKYRIPLDRYRFAIQKRAETIGSVFKEVYAKGDEQRAKRLLHSLANLLKRRSEKGIRNLDLNVSRNYGFIGDQAVEVDFGSYSYSREGISDFEITASISRLSEFFLSVAPEWGHLIEEIE